MEKKYIRFHETLVAPPADSPAPKSVWANTKKDGVQYLAGSGKFPARVMILTPHPEEEEVDDTRGSPAAMKGTSGALLRRILLRAGIPDDQYYFTSLLKWCPPRGYKISMGDAERMSEALRAELKKVKPDVVICMGKLPFQFLFKRNLALKKVLGGWFFSEEFNVRLYVTNEPWILLKKPEYFNKFLVDLKEVRNTVWNLQGNDPNPRNVEITVVHNMAELRALTETIFRELPAGYLGVDIESGGSQIPPDGFMRSLQVAWSKTKAAYIRFYDDNANYVFDMPMKEAGEEIAKWYSNPKYNLVGHQLATDLTWVYFHLGLDFYKRAGWDTLYAEHCIDEASDLKLERLSVKYTNLGRYDMDLLLCKESMHIQEDDGYAFIPDNILIPYACKDVVVLLRILPQQMQKLQEEETLSYFMSMNLPFVTDVFTEMTTAGLPINIDYLENLRHAFHRVQEFLDKRLIDLVRQNTFQILLRTMAMQDPHAAVKEFTVLEDILKAQDWDTLEARVRQFAKKEWGNYFPITKQLRGSNQFNIRSSEQMRHWLFKVKKFTPLKTTKKDGFSMPWEKVMELPESRQAAYSPAVDKNTLKVFAKTDKLVDFILQLNGVGNITKGFLKNADAQGKEQGVAKWVSIKDRAIHTNFALTETGRCRTWNPNILNYNKVVSDFVARGFAQYNEEAEKGNIEGGKLKSTGVRTIVQSRPGWVFIDSDWATAEVVALAYIAGDADMIKTLTEPDKNYALMQVGKDTKPVRVSYAYDSSIPANAQDLSILVSENHPDLVRVGDKLLRPKRDIHWEVAEMVNRCPREKLNKDIHRQSAKITNFCIAEGELVLTRDRGLVPIEEINHSDLLWDGHEWVSHAGVVYSGEKEVICYQGFSATPLHFVWTEEKGKIRLGEASAQSLTLVRGTNDSGEPIQQTAMARNSGAAQKQREGRKEKVRTYDILNAGPRHRFTCSGVIVSNSTPYGATGSSIEYQIEVLTGIKPEPGTGDALIDGRAKRYPVADMYLKGQEFVPFDPGFYRSISGRLRHFHYNTVENVDGISDWAKKQILSPLIRQARNFPIQEIVGASMMRAQIALLHAVREFRMSARNPISLYDAMLSHCPMEERWAIWNLHHYCMSYSLQWETPGGLLQFDIDPEMAFRWGDKHSKEEKELLDGEDGKDHPVALAFPLRSGLVAV